MKKRFVRKKRKARFLIEDESGRGQRCCLILYYWEHLMVICTEISNHESGGMCAERSTRCSISTKNPLQQPRGISSLGI